MNLKKLSPWNWLRKESQQGANVPVRRAERLPADPLARFHDEFDRLFASLLHSFGEGIVPAPLSQRLGEVVLRPRLDIAERDDAYEISVEIPGVSRDDVQIAVDDRTLVISGEKKLSSERDEGQYHWVERSYGQFQRVLDLPDDADETGISASFKDGVLTIRIPRRKQAGSGARRIEIQS